MAPSLTLLALAALGGAAAPADDHLAERRTGLWEQQLTLDGGGHALAPSQICIDAKTAPRLTIVGAQMDRSKCETYALTPGEGRSWSFRSVCRLSDGAVATTTGEVTGNLWSHYDVRATAVTTGAASPRMNGTHTFTITATRIGPCPAGMTGGDVTTAGKTTNVFAP